MLVQYCAHIFLFFAACYIIKYFLEGRQRIRRQLLGLPSLKRSLFRFKETEEKTTMAIDSRSRSSKYGVLLLLLFFTGSFLVRIFKGREPLYFLRGETPASLNNVRSNGIDKERHLQRGVEQPSSTLLFPLSRLLYLEL